MIWFSLVLWYINHCGLFNAKYFPVELNRAKLRTYAKLIYSNGSFDI